MEIHLSKPGGKREGPYTLEQINAGLPQHTFLDTDYWAWYEGLESWVPLHQIPGIIRPSEAPAESPPAAAADPVAPDGDTEIILTPGAGGAVAPDSRLYSGMPAQAL